MFAEEAVKTGCAALGDAGRDIEFGKRYIRFYGESPLCVVDLAVAPQEEALAGAGGLAACDAVGIGAA